MEHQRAKRAADRLGPDWAGADEPAPPLSVATAQALHCWNWCDGWQPERWPLYLALYPVTDFDTLTGLMQLIRQDQAAPQP